jgi:hypothetical protein
LKGFAAVGADTCWPVSVSLQGEFGGEMQEPRKLNVVGMVSGERSLLYTRER